MMTAGKSFQDTVIDAAVTIPGSVAPWGRGWSAALASILEAAAAKPGNVHPGQSFDDLTFADFVAAGSAIAAPLDSAADRPLGITILNAVQAASSATRSNANLGIILLIAPIAASSPHDDRLGAAHVNDVLDRLTTEDAASIWNAIQLARPGGMGKADRHDLGGPPPSDIRQAMELAADRDTIANVWTHGFESIFRGPVADLAADLAASVPLETAIIRTHLRQLARQPDSLITRRHGTKVAGEVSSRARDLVALEDSPEWSRAVAAFDASLRAPRRLNPGTTADMIAAALYILLRDGRLRPLIA